MNLLEDIKNRVRSARRRILLAETHDDRVMQAAVQIAREGFCRPLVLGVPDALADPRVGVFAGQTPLAASDNWQDSPMKDEIIAAGIAPANDLESALILTLDPGAYTAVLSGGTGNGLIAVWNLE